MNKKQVIFLALCGLLIPNGVQAGGALAESLSAGMKGALESLGEHAGQLADMISSAAKEMVEAAGDKAEALAAVKGLFKDLGENIQKLGGSLKEMAEGDVKGVMEQFGKSLEDSLNDLKVTFKDNVELGGSAGELASRLGKVATNFSSGFKSSFESGLEGLKLSPQTMQALDEAMGTALQENARLLAAQQASQAARGAETPTPAGTSTEAAGQIGQATARLQSSVEDIAARADALPEGAAAKDQQQLALKTLPDKDWEGDVDWGEEEAGEAAGEKSGAGHAEGEEGGVELVGPEDGGFGPEAEVKTSVGQRIKNWGSDLKSEWDGKAAEAKQLTAKINKKQAQLEDLQASVAKKRISVSEQGDTATIGAEHFERVGGSKESSAVLQDALERGDYVAKKGDVSVAEDRFGDVTVSVKVKGASGKETTVTYKMTDTTSIERGFLKDDRTQFVIGKNGKLSVRGDEEAVSVVRSDIANAEKMIGDLKEELTTLRAGRSEVESYGRAAFRLGKQSFGTVDRFLTRAGKMLRNEKAHAAEVALRATKSGATRFAKKTWWVAKKVSSGTLEVLKMMMTGVFFGIPSMIYQTLMQNAQARALYEEITAVYHITPDLAVQIPSSLIPEANAGQAGTYLYVAVNPSTDGFGKAFSTAELQNGSFYVVYQTGAQWGSTYATSQNAFGVWVNLNTGLIFMDGGVPYSDQTPFAYLLEPTNDATLQATKGAQTTLSVQQYTQQAYDAVGNRANYNYAEGFLDSIAPWGIKASNSAITPNAELQTLFAPVEASHTSGHENIQKASRYAPQLLVPTLNKLRAGIQNVTGFLPASASSLLPAISVKQFAGTGILNCLLGSQSSSANIEQSINMMLALTTNTPAASGPAAAAASSKGGGNPLQAVTDAQNALQSALEEAGNKEYGDDVIAAVAKLKDARSALQSAITSVAKGTNPGLDPSFDVNAYNIYLYETEDTPVVDFMKQHRASSLIPVKDYVVFLDGNYNIVPLVSTGLLTRKDGIGVIDFDFSQVNSNIQYMASLVTGTAYSFNSKGPGQLAQNLGNMPAAQYIASTVMANLFQTVAQVLTTSDATNLINQILSMANYATNLSYEGPLVKNGCIFERVPLESSYQDTQQASVNLVLSDINGITIPPAQSATSQSPFGTLASGQNTWLPSLYVYKVSKFIPGSSAGAAPVQEGVFGKDPQGREAYDYVVPFAPVALQNQDGSSTTYYQIMPLGIAGTSAGSSLMMASLVTGQVYDANYCLLTNPPYSATVIKRNSDFQPLTAQPGQFSVQVQSANGPVQVAAVQNVPLGTGFMPTFCNPYNLIYSQMQGDPEYASDFAAVSDAQTQLSSLVDTVNGMLDTAVYGTYAQEIWRAVQGMNVQTTPTLSQQYIPYLLLPGEAQGQPGQLFTAMQSWITEKGKLITAEQKLSERKQKLESNLKPPFAPVAKTIDQMLIMCPMYWMHYAQFAYAPQSASAQTIQYTVGQQQQSAVINWISSTPNSSPTPLGYGFGQAVPKAFIQDVITAYNSWEEIMNSSDGAAKILQSGPFQFTQNMKCNVYLTLPPTNGSATSIGTGNFFYNMVPVAPTTSLFVIGELDSSLASQFAAGTASSAPSVTLDQCNVGSRLGTSYLGIANPVAIDISTGDVWLPVPFPTAASCYGNKGNIAMAKCNITKIGTVDPQEALNLALKNQGSSQAALAQANPGLYSMVMNCQSLANQAAQLSLSPFYFAGQLLSLCKEQVAHQTYIYAVNVTADNYYNAVDYWVATDQNFNPIGQLTPQTNYMVSLVSGNQYQMNVPAQSGQGQQQTEQATAQDQSVGIGAATNETPQTAFQRLFGVGSYGSSVTATLLTAVPGNNPKLFAIIESLNQVQNQNFLQAQFASSSNGQLSVAPLPLAQLQAASPVSPLYNNLYQVGSKYYLAMPGTKGAPTYYYDFNAQTQDVSISTQGTPVYTPVAGDAKRGMYYVVEGSTATPASALTGYGCEAMRMRFGIKVAADGTQTIGLPVYNPPLPMTDKDKALAAGADGDNMKCLSIPGKTKNSVGVSDTYKYYYYTNTVSSTYLARCVLNTTIPVYDPVKQTFASIADNEDYYVDLITGECYAPDGTPRLSKVSVAYGFSGTPSTGMVKNSQLDFSNPLFMWGELDVLGEATQTNMFYQDTNSSDPSNGYNQYQLQPASTVFTVFTGGANGAAGSQTTYAYSTQTDANNNPLVTQNGTVMSPAQTSLSDVLVAALNAGASLLSKSYLMNIGGIIPSGTAAPGSSVTVTETFTNPKQYMVSYTNQSGAVVNDMFQAPVLGDPGNLPGASANLYNNPPLGASLQQQLMQATPFCARVFASSPYGQETAANVNIQQLGSTPVTCGLLYQPTTASSFTLPSAGLLSLVFSGANPNSSAGAANGQYFAFYDSYNNGVAGSISAVQSSNVVPSKGEYGTFISVVSSMGTNMGTSPYPGLYAGNFNVNFSTAAAAAANYGAPYLRVVGSLPGTMNSNTLTTNYVPPTSGTEYLYKYQFDIVSNAMLSQLKSLVNISGNLNGFTQLVSALDAATLQSVTVSNPTLNPVATAVIQNQVMYATPVSPTIQEKEGRFVYKLSCGASGADMADGASTSPLCELFYPTPAGGGAAPTTPDTYIDIFNGIVFQSQTGAGGKALLYPVGFSVTQDMRNAITFMIGGAIANKAGALTVQQATPGTANVTKPGGVVAAPVASATT